MRTRVLAREVVPGTAWPRRTFAVGKLTRKSAEILLSEGNRAFPAPFLLKAVVSGAREPRLGQTIH